MGKRDEGVGEADTAYLLPSLADCIGVEAGRRIRFIDGDVEEDDGESGATMLTPVVFGDRGDAIIGAGMVCRFDIGGEGV